MDIFLNFFRPGGVYVSTNTRIPMYLAHPLLNTYSHPTNFPSPMKKNLKKSNRAHYSLGDLIMAVSSYTRNNRETVAAVADLLESGRVRFSSQGRKIRARVY
jgi:hypothetical protein